MLNVISHQENQVETTRWYHFTPTRRVRTKKKENHQHRQEGERLEPLHSAGGERQVL